MWRMPGNKFAMKYKTEWEFYDTYKLKKCSKNCYRQRFMKGMPLKEAISPIHKTAKTTRVVVDGRECSVCGEFKHWDYFSPEKIGINGRTSNCKECRNKKHREARKKKEINEAEKEYKRKHRETEIGKLQKTLDNIYYRDKQIMRNRAILRSIWEEINRGRAVEAKIDYFVNRGFKMDLLEKIYSVPGEKNRK